VRLSRKHLDEHADLLYDAIVVGGGAGGLSAGLYLARYNLKVLVIEKGRGRSFWMTDLTNYLGFPEHISGRELLKRGEQHLYNVGGNYLFAHVEEVTDQGEYFDVRVKTAMRHEQEHTFRAKYIVAASGIIDQLPKLDDMQNVYQYAGYNLHVCLICDGYEINDTRCALICGSEGQINTAFVLNWFTPYITVLTHGLFEVGPEMRQKLEDHGYPLIETPIQRFLGKSHTMDGIEFSDCCRHRPDSDGLSLPQPIPERHSPREKWRKFSHRRHVPYFPSAYFCHWGLKAGPQSDFDRGGGWDESGYGHLARYSSSGPSPQMGG
jgi:thioredoxin reductase (NADPH)